MVEYQENWTQGCGCLVLMWNQLERQGLGTSPFPQTMSLASFRERFILLDQIFVFLMYLI